MTTNEKVIGFVADVLDSTLEQGDDGSVICFKDGKQHIDLLFDEQGEFSGMEVQK